MQDTLVHAPLLYGLIIQLIKITFQRVMFIKIKTFQNTVESQK